MIWFWFGKFLPKVEPLRVPPHVPCCAIFVLTIYQNRLCDDLKLFDLLNNNIDTKFTHAKPIN